MNKNRSLNRMMANKKEKGRIENYDLRERERERERRGRKSGVRVRKRERGASKRGTLNGDELTMKWREKCVRKSQMGLLERYVG